MDAIDREIVAILQREGRITLTVLAERIHLSLSRCQRRVRDLEADAVIVGYRAMVDSAKLGFGFEVLAFATLQHPGDLDDFDKALLEIPEVIEAQRLFGEPDYILRIVTADMAAYRTLYEESLAKLPGLGGLNSTIVMKQTVEPRPLPRTVPRSTRR